VRLVFAGCESDVDLGVEHGMRPNTHWIKGRERSVDEERQRMESEWLLDAIVGAIVAGKLPPDDARAWAMIAAYEVKAFEASPSSQAA
jgi:hypothetical protein